MPFLLPIKTKLSDKNTDLCWYRNWWISPHDDEYIRHLFLDTLGSFIVICYSTTALRRPEQYSLFIMKHHLREQNGVCFTNTTTQFKTTSSIG